MERAVQPRKKETSVVTFKSVPRNSPSLQKYSHAYLPRLNRQATEISHTTRLDEQLQDLSQAIRHNNMDDAVDGARVTAKQILNRLLLTLKKISTIDFKSTYEIENIPQFDRDTSTLYYVLPFRYDMVRIETLDPGYVTFALPKIVPKNKDMFKTLSDYDGVHVSPLKFQSYISELIQKAVKRINGENKHTVKGNYDVGADEQDIDFARDGNLLKMCEYSGHRRDKENPEISENNVDLMADNRNLNISREDEESWSANEICCTKDGDNLCIPTLDKVGFRLPFTITLACGWNLEILPAIFLSPADPVYVMKPYDVDENIFSDIRWRICCAHRETGLLKSIFKTDQDVRLEAMNIVIECLKFDSRLTLISPYQIQTCLLHDMDIQMDSDPRWQRESLQKCTMSLLRRIYRFIANGILPHFFSKDFNLIEYWSESQLKLAKSALGRLISEEVPLTNLIQRTLHKNEKQKLLPSYASGCSNDYH